MDKKSSRSSVWMIYGVSLIYGLGLTASIVTGTGALTAGFGAAAVLTLVAASSGYGGGARFLGGTLAMFLFIVCGVASYQEYRQANDTLPGGLFFCAEFALASAALFWSGHKQHLKKFGQFEIEKSGDEADPGKQFSAAGAADPAEALLYPPTPVWRVFLLLFCSMMIYSCFLTYRIVKDLTQISDTRLNPKRCSWMMLVPLYNFSVFYKIATRVNRTAKSQGIALKASPGVLLAIAAGGEIGGWITPDFMFPLSLMVGAAPWLILHAGMNGLRRNAGLCWREEPERYSWRQRAVLLVGIPLIGIALYASRTELAYYSGEKLVAEQVVEGVAGNYRLTIPNRSWRRLQPGTLIADSDMELRTDSNDEWVVIRVSPSERQSLDHYVDQRQALIAEDWRDFKVEEARTLMAESDLRTISPLSLARYTKSTPSFGGAEEIYVATLIEHDKLIEVIGQGGKRFGGHVEELVRSFRLSAGGNES
ncbi:hypothetical protein [Methylomonas sp. HYX-M1]|uniref:hypothetical protein n=1 Tax=Methylomonas sp. HYX-M1 TaxID=3139307 RepID=UPI00345BBC89